MRQGFSTVEALLAVAVFSLLITAFSGTYLYGEESTMLAGNRARAVLLAEEGLEAARNIRDAGFVNLTDGTFGVVPSGGEWTLSGLSDVNDIFTRSLTIATVDSNRKAVTSAVSWQQNAQRNETATLITYLTNWQKENSVAGGLLAYGRTAVSAFSRLYDAVADSFGSADAIVGSSVGSTFVVRTSPTKTEAVAGYVTAAGVLNVICFDGSSWSTEWTATVGGTGTTRRFDIAYETNSGEAIVLYSANGATTNELSYRTKSGASSCGSAHWSGTTNLDPIRTSGIVQWVKLAWDRRTSSNLITAIWADSQSDLSAMVWNGSTWGNEPTAASETSLEVVAVAQDIDDFDVEYESLSGDVMMVWANSAGSNGTNGVRYRMCTGGIATCTWTAVTTPPTFSDDATNLDISANPITDEIVFASIGNAGSDLQLGYWSGTIWTNSANVDTSCTVPVAGSRMVATGWLISGASTRSVVTYADSGSSRLDWYLGSAGVFTVQSDITLSPSPLSTRRVFDIQMDPLNADRALLLMSDSANDLFAKRVVLSTAGAGTWTNSDGAALETSLPQATNYPFGYAFWRQ